MTFSIDTKSRLPLRCRCWVLFPSWKELEGVPSKSSRDAANLFKFAELFALLLSSSTSSHTFIIHLQTLLRPSIRIKGLFTFKVSLFEAIPRAHPSPFPPHCLRVLKAFIKSCSAGLKSSIARAFSCTLHLVLRFCCVFVCKNLEFLRRR
jgi:hypothetical protein